MTRAVFDCVILLQAAARRTGPAAECLQAVRDGRLKLFLSPDIDLMGDVTFRRQFPGLTVIDPVALLRELTLAQPKPEPDQRPEDGEGEMGHEAG